MSTETTIIFVVTALLVGSGIGFAVSLYLAKAKQQAADSTLADRLLDKDSQIAEAKKSLDDDRRLAADERRALSTTIDELQGKLREAGEARAKLEGAGESLEALKAQLEAKSAEIVIHVERITTLSSDRSRFKTEAEEATRAKNDALAAKTVEADRLLREKEDAVVAQIAEMRGSSIRQLADKEAASASQLKALRDHCDAQLAEKDRHVEEMRQQLADAEKRLTETFDSLSVKALTKIGEQFMAAAKATFETAQVETKGELKLRQQAVEELLKPFSETMKALDKRCQETDEKAASAQGLLKEHLDRLMGATESLSTAFRKPNSRGNWGEGTLRNVLEQSGLQEGHDFELQHSTDSEDGKLRADAIVNLPKGRRLVIDSKNLWDGYQQATAATDEPSRQLLLQKHTQAVRNQVRQLSAKAYWQQYDGLDCVVMFLPTEAMFQAALEQDKDLLNDAIANRVYLASPMTLVGLLRAVQYVLDQERLNQNALEISETGKKLYEALHTFGAHYAKVGNNLRRTVDTYNDSLGSLERNVLSKARQLRSKGIGSTTVLAELEGVAALPSHLRSAEFAFVSDESLVDSVIGIDSQASLVALEEA